MKPSLTSLEDVRMGKLGSYKVVPSSPSQPNRKMALMVAFVFE